MKCVFLFSVQLLPETFLILRKTERDIITNVYWSSSKVSVILLRLQSNLNFLDRFSEHTQIPNFTKIRPVTAELLHRTDRWTEMTKPIVAFRNLANAPKNG
jgi:hypothetical protein